MNKLLIVAVRGYNKSMEVVFHIKGRMFKSYYQLGDIRLPFSDTLVSSQAVFQVWLWCDITSKGVRKMTIS